MKKILLCAFAVILCACSQTPEDRLLDYQQRVARVLDQEIPAAEKITRVERVAVTHFKMPLPDYRINLLELLSLNQCRIGQAVAQKNSALGKVAAASQRLIQELAILRDGDECVTLLRNKDAELAAELQTALQQKYTARMHYWWNAWLTAEEWQRFIASAAQPLDWPKEAYDKPAHSSRTLEALDFAIHQGQQIKAADFSAPENMETQLQQLMLGESLGRWLASVYLLTSVLNNTTQIIEQRLAYKPLCPTGEKTPQADILNNVFWKVYAAEVQPYLSLTDKLGKQLMIRLNTMQQLLQENPPAEFTGWLQQVKETQQDFNQANQRHVKAWQTALKQCGLMPGE